jgi:hypothetical protein
MMTPHLPLDTVVVIPFRFIDGIMRACQRYTTHG